MRKREILLALLLTACTLVTACGGNGGAQTQEKQKTANGTKAYGRYVETQYGLNGEVERNGGFTQCSDGSLKLIGYNTGIWTSENEGETWTCSSEPWMQLLQNTYCPCAVFAPDGTMAAISNGAISDTVVKAVEEGRILTPEEQSAADGEAAPEGEAVKNIWNQSRFGILVTPEGEIRYLDFGLDYSTENYSAMEKLWFSPDNCLFGTAVDGSVYEVDQENGALTLLFTADSKVGYVTFADNSLLTVGRNNLYRYDLKKSTLLEVNPAIDSFIAEKIGNGDTSFTIGSYPVALAVSPDGKSLYLSCQDGLYRGALEGSKVEKIIDGALSTFGDDEVLTLKVLEGERFLAQFADNSLLLYTYDGTMLTMPEKELSVYSFMEQPLVRTAVTNYKKAHQDVYVRYEVGYNGEDGVSEDDAVKKLNVRLAAGEGPDVLIQDQLRTDTYREKGILADMTELFAGMQGEEELLPNIVEGMKTDGKLYMMPMCFTVPVIAGKAEDIKQAQTLDGLADYMEENAKEGSGGLIGVHDAAVLAQVLSLGAEQAWLRQDNTLDEEKIRDFLTQSKRIYDAENLAVTQVMREEIDGIDTAANDYIPGGAAQARESVGENVLYLLGGYQKLAIGEMQGIWFDCLQLVSMQQIMEGMEFGSYQGQGEKLFRPSVLVSINAASRNREEAERFVKVMFSRETQEDISSFPVNKDLLRAEFVPAPEAVDEKNENYKMGGSSMGYPIAGKGGYSSSETGMMDLYWPDPQQTQQFLELLTSAATPAIGLPLLQNVVCDTAVQVMEGTTSVEDGMEQIRREMTLYMAE